MTEVEVAETPTATYVIGPVLQLPPGSGSWLGTLEAASGQAESRSIYYSIEARLREAALDAVFVALVDGPDLLAAGNFFFAAPTPQPGPTGAWVDYGLRGELASKRDNPMILVVWSGLETNATVRLGAPEGMHIIDGGLAQGGFPLASWTLGDRNLVLRSGQTSQTMTGPSLLWVDFWVAQPGTGNLTVTGGGQTHRDLVEAQLVATLHRFAGVWGPTQVDIHYSLSSIGSDSGLYGILVPLPVNDLAPNWWVPSVCAVCT